MKRLLILGVGAQGSTVAKRMNEEPGGSEIICADYDEKAVDEMERTLEKAKAIALPMPDPLPVTSTTLFII